MEMQYEFGDFRLVPRQHRLEYHGEPVHLPPKALHLLTALLEANGSLLAKDQLIRLVWPELKHVEPNTLDQTVFVVRKTLAQFNPDAQYVLTVPRVGYMWNPAVTREPRHEPPPQRTRRARWLGGIAAVSLLGLAGAGWFAVRRHLEKRRQFEQAQQIYQEGRNMWRMRAGDPQDRFRMALRLAPQFAEAYAGLADQMAFDEPPAPEAFEAVNKALSLNPNSGEAYTTLGFLQMVHRWDWRGAEQSFVHALKLEPRYPTAHHWYGLLLRSTARVPAARSQLEEAARLDPTAPAILDDLAWQCVVEGRYMQGHYELGLLLSRYPAYHNPVNERWKATLLWKGRAAAIPQAIDAAGTSNRKALEEVWKTRGVEVFWDRFAQQAPGPSYVAAERWIVAGRKDLALASLERAADAHEFLIFEIQPNPLFAPLRSEPRFHSILKKMGLE